MLQGVAASGHCVGILAGRERFWAGRVTDLIHPKDWHGASLEEQVRRWQNASAVT